MTVQKIGMFYATGTNSATATIAAQAGTILCKRLGWDSPGSGTLVIYRASQACLASAAVTNSTTLVVKTDASGYVGGAVLTTSDYILVWNTCGTGTATYLQSISAVAAVSSSTVSLTLGGAIYCAANDKIYVVRAADIVTLTVGNESVRNVYDAFVSYPEYPVRLVLAATGTCRVNGNYEVLR